MAGKSLHIPSFMTRPGLADKPRPAMDKAPPPPPVHAMPARPQQERTHTGDTIDIKTLAQMTRGGQWQLEQLHQRDHHLLLWTTRGQGRLLLHGLRRGFGAHNAVFVPAGKLLAIETGRHVQGQVLIVPNDGRVQLPDRAQHLRLQDGLAQAELTGLLDDLRRELNENRPLLSESLTAIASLISIWLRRQMLVFGPQPRTTAAERIVRRFADLLAEDYRSGRSMQEYAEDLGITPTHLTRVCKQTSGLTAADMLSQIVQHDARTLLTTTELPINEIADSLGFGSAAYFTRFSQQHFGAAPSQIRKASTRS